MGILVSVLGSLGIHKEDIGIYILQWQTYCLWQIKTSCLLMGHSEHMETKYCFAKLTWLLQNSFP